jgi:DnaK suppressor protein
VVIRQWEDPYGRIYHKESAMDEIDIAQEQDQVFRDYTLFVTMRMLRKKEYNMPLMMDGVRYCVDCKDEIPEERLSIRPGAVRCVHCQTRKERTYYNMLLEELAKE